jgi:hypothetical protein
MMQMTGSLTNCYFEANKKAGAVLRRLSLYLIYLKNDISGDMVIKHR